MSNSTISSETPAPYPQLIEAIHASPGRFALAVTGGGTSAIADLLSVAGASRTVLEATVPYHGNALRAYLNHTPEQACSARTARHMAMAAWQRARLIDVGAPVYGLGCTAAIKTNRRRKGEQRCHIAVQGAALTLEINVEPGRNQSRRKQEQIIKEIIINTMAEILGLTGQHDPPRTDALVTRRCHNAAPAWQALWDAGDSATSTHLAFPDALLPGTFNPTHQGHLTMLEVAADLLGTRVCPEISIRNVEKPPLDYLDMWDRQAALTGHEVIFSRTATFEEKARLFPGTTFVVGLDTIVRVADPKYYDNDIRLRDQAIGNLVTSGNSFLVFGRLQHGRFETLDQIQLPRALKAICTQVPESRFRVDISSTELRLEKSTGPVSHET